jgi:hypothetical protein
MLSPNDSDAVTHQWWWDAYHLRSWPDVVTKYVKQVEPAANDGDKEKAEEEGTGRQSKASSSDRSGSPANSGESVDPNALDSVSSSHTSFEAAEAGSKNS